MIFPDRLAVKCCWSTADVRLAVYRLYLCVYVSSSGPYMTFARLMLCFLLMFVSHNCRLAVKSSQSAIRRQVWFVVSLHIEWWGTPHVGEGIVHLWNQLHLQMIYTVLHSSCYSYVSAYNFGILGEFTHQLKTCYSTVDHSSNSRYTYVVFVSWIRVQCGWYRGRADKALARPGRKQATATKLCIYSTYSPTKLNTLLSPLR